MKVTLCPGDDADGETWTLEKAVDVVEGILGDFEGTSIDLEVESVTLCEVTDDE